MKSIVMVGWMCAGLVAAGTATALGQTPRAGGSAQTTQPTDVPNRIVVPFSDPSRVGTVHVRVLRGSVSITAGSSRDVVVEASGSRIEGPGRRRDRVRDSARADGLRRLDQPFGFDVREEGNVVTVTTGPLDQGRLSIVVPPRTNLQVNVVNGDGISIEGIEGEIEANSVNGSVTLTNVSGAAVAHSVNGEVRASLRQLAGSPMAFTSLNGEVDITLPASAKANLRLRSDHGEMYTDFDVQTTPAPRDRGAASRTSRAGRDAQAADRDPGKLGDAFRIEMDRALYGTINGGGPELELRTFNGNVYLRKAK